MKLTELDPRWSALEGRHGMGVTFMCPSGKDHRIGANFANPIDGGEPFSSALWQRNGENFETITISPSIREMDDEGRECWHGFIANGEIRTV